MGDYPQIAGRVLFLAGCILFSVLVYLVGLFSIHWLANRILMLFVNSNMLSEGWAIVVLALLMTTLVPYVLARFSVSAPNYQASEVVAIFFCLAVAAITVISIIYLIFTGLSGTMRLLYLAPLVQAVSAITGAVNGGYSHRK
jgi:hypothetical protein